MISFTLRSLINKQQLDLIRLVTQSDYRPSRPGTTAITPADLSHRRSEQPWAGKGMRLRWKRSPLKARSPGAQWDTKTLSAPRVRSFHLLTWWCCESCPGVVGAFCAAAADGAEEKERQQNADSRWWGILRTALRFANRWEMRNGWTKWTILKVNEAKGRAQLFNFHGSMFLPLVVRIYQVHCGGKSGIIIGTCHL